MDYQESRNLTHQMAHDLGVAIIEGKYASKTGIPTEAILCEQYGVSRTATREAVKMLTAKGMISSRPRQGISICPESDWNMFDTDLLKWILYSQPTTQLLREFTEMRIAFEPEAARLAAANGSDDDINEITIALDKMAKAEMGLEDPLESDIAFHRAIMFASQNRFFIHLRKFVETALRVNTRLTNRVKGSPGGDVPAHRNVLQAIQERQPEKAAHEMRLILTEVTHVISKAESLNLKN